MASVKDVKAGDEYNADIGDVFKLLTGIGEVGCKDRAIIADTALMIGVISLLHFNVRFPSVSKDAFGIKDQKILNKKIRTMGTRHKKIRKCEK